jgi:wobble nucleotide-excising tRNase
MPSNTTIRRIKSIRSGGIFGDCRPSPDLPNFSATNLIYGFNASGKSTLSMLMASLGQENSNVDLPTGCAYSIELSDGIALGVSEGHPIADKVMTFNTDFVTKNLSWTDATASPVFYIGEEQSGVLENIRKLKIDRNSLEAEKASSKSSSDTLASAFAQFKTDQARIIATEASLGRNYQAPDFENDCENFDVSRATQFTEQEEAAAKSIVRAEAPQPKLSSIKVQLPRLADHRLSAQAIAALKYSDVVLQELQEHESMIGWVRDGLHYHQKADLDSCLFCKQELTKDRIANLERALDDKFDEMIHRAEAKIAELKDLDGRLTSINVSLPRPSELSADLRRGYEQVISELEPLLITGHNEIDLLVKSLVEKIQKPQSIRVLRSKCLPPEKCAEWDDRLRACIAGISVLIAQHNENFDNFENNQTVTGEKLKSHLIGAVVDSFEEMKAACESAQILSTENADGFDSISERIEGLEESLKQHSVAAGKINKMISGYLGHDELEFIALDKGYEIRRKGQLLDGPLSEGEKTAVALCYFLACLESDGKQIKDLIVILDDPISSLDTRALSYALAMVKSYCGGACQLIVLTHNLYFMNELKKWIGTHDDDDKDKLFFIEITKCPETGSRRSQLVRLPKYIRDYESEYQYLFHLVLEFSKSGGADEKHLFVMPNALRKVLDTFLAFKVPGSMGLKPKVMKIGNDNPELDTVKLSALEGLVQLESHADSLDDLVTMSSLTVEEVFDATDALLHLIEVTDPAHFKQMKSICK